MPRITEPDERWSRNQNKRQKMANKNQILANNFQAEILRWCTVIVVLSLMDAFSIDHSNPIMSKLTFVFTCLVCVVNVFFSRFWGKRVCGLDKKDLNQFYFSGVLLVVVNIGSICLQLLSPEFNTRTQALQILSLEICLHALVIGLRVFLSRKLLDPSLAWSKSHPIVHLRNTLTQSPEEANEEYLFSRNPHWPEIVDSGVVDADDLKNVEFILNTRDKVVRARRKLSECQGLGIPDLVELKEEKVEKWSKILRSLQTNPLPQILDRMPRGEPE